MHVRCGFDLAENKRNVKTDCGRSTQSLRALAFRRVGCKQCRIAYIDEARVYDIYVRGIYYVINYE